MYAHCPRNSISLITYNNFYFYYFSGSERMVAIRALCNFAPPIIAAQKQNRMDHFLPVSDQGICVDKIRSATTGA